MKWIQLLRGDPLPWLLEPDPLNPAVRYFALRDLLDRPDNDLEVRQAALDIMKTGPVPVILAAQHPDGYWVEPGNGYGPGYKSTVFQIVLLVELGATPGHKQVQRGCEYVLGHAMAANGAFAVGEPPVPSKAVHCHHGHMVRALLLLGFASDPRVVSALNWLVHAITGEGDIRYYKSGTSGPTFACAVNLKQPCGWGAVKAMGALATVPVKDRSPAMERAIEIGIEFLLGRDPAVADYPYTGRVSSSWFKFCFPSSYWSDVLETAAVVADLGYGSDPRLQNAVQLHSEQTRCPGSLEVGEHAQWQDVDRHRKERRA